MQSSWWHICLHLSGNPIDELFFDFYHILFLKMPWRAIKRAAHLAAQQSATRCQSSKGEPLVEMQYADFVELQHANLSTQSWRANSLFCPTFQWLFWSNYRPNYRNWQSIEFWEIKPPFRVWLNSLNSTLFRLWALNRCCESKIFELPRCSKWSF